MNRMLIGSLVILLLLLGAAAAFAQTDPMRDPDANQGTLPAEQWDPNQPSSIDWDEASRSALDDSFFVRKNPLRTSVEVVYVTGPMSRLVFRAHHGVMDGKGILEFVGDVMRSLGGEAPLGATGTATDLDLAIQLEPPPEPRLAETCLAPTGLTQAAAAGTTGNTAQPRPTDSPSPSGNRSTTSASASSSKTERFSGTMSQQPGAPGLVAASPQGV